MVNIPSAFPWMFFSVFSITNVDCIAENPETDTPRRKREKRDNKYILEKENKTRVRELINAP